MKKVSAVAAAITSVLMTGAVFAETEVALDVIAGDEAAPVVEKVNGTDVIADGWEIFGYASMNFRTVDGKSVDTEFGKPDYKTAGTHGKSTNQVEFIIKSILSTRTVFGLTLLFALNTATATLMPTLLRVAKKTIPLHSLK